jgi:hypothetical protein
LYLSESSPEVILANHTYTEAWMALTVAGSTTTTVQLRVNASTIATISITSGDGVGPILHDIEIPVVADDLLTVKLTVVGTGAQGLMVRMI